MDSCYKHVCSYGCGCNFAYTIKYGFCNRKATYIDTGKFPTTDLFIEIVIVSGLGVPVWTINEPVPWKTYCFAKVTHCAGCILATTYKTPIASHSSAKSLSHINDRVRDAVSVFAQQRKGSEMCVDGTVPLLLITWLECSIVYNSHMMVTWSHHTATHTLH